jgi:hypothetical protein
LQRTDELGQPRRIGLADGAQLLEVAERFKLEGIVSKRRAAP